MGRHKPGPAIRERPPRAGMSGSREKPFFKEKNSKRRRAFGAFVTEATGKSAYDRFIPTGEAAKKIRSVSLSRKKSKKLCILILR